MQNPHHFLHVGRHVTCDTWLPCRYARQNSPGTPSPPLTREKVHPATGPLVLNREKTRPARHKTPILGCFQPTGRTISRSRPGRTEQGELFRAHVRDGPSRANFFALRTQPRGNCETTITTATADADQRETTITNARSQTATIETTITSATENHAKNTHFSPAKAMAVSSGARPAPAKATPVSRERFPMHAGHGTS